MIVRVKPNSFIDSPETVCERLGVKYVPVQRVLRDTPYTIVIDVNFMELFKIVEGVMPNACYAASRHIYSEKEFLELSESLVSVVDIYNYISPI